MILPWWADPAPMRYESFFFIVTIPPNAWMCASAQSSSRIGRNCWVRRMAEQMTLPIDLGKVLCEWLHCHPRDSLSTASISSEKYHTYNVVQCCRWRAIPSQSSINFLVWLHLKRNVALTSLQHSKVKCAIYCLIGSITISTEVDGSILKVKRKYTSRSDVRKGSEGITTESR